MTQLKPLYDKKLECKLCKQPFTTKKVRSRFVKVNQYDTDFRPVYSSDENNPILYYVNVCPGCGFSFTDDFMPYFPPGTKEAIIEKICSQWVPREFSGKRSMEDAIKTYKLAVYAATLKREKHIVISGLYIRLAWLYRSMENEEQEQRFTKLALKEYIDSYTTDDYKGTQVSELRIFYLIGELSRRVNDLNQATRYFSKVIEKQNQTIETKIVDMAKERWHEIRDRQKLAEEVGDQD